MGILSFLALATAGAAATVAAVLSRIRPVPWPGFCALLALCFLASAVLVYCCGWFAVTLGGPFPVVCADENAAGARVETQTQTFWPLRNACVYSDGSTVEHLSPTYHVLIRVLAGAAAVLGGVAALLRLRARRPCRGPG